MALARATGSRRLRASLLILCGLALVAYFAYSSIARNEPELHAEIDEHYKYGSIGAEGHAGIPYWIWLVLPEVFAEHLPQRPGEGYARVGFIYESPDRVRPIGTSLRQNPLPMVGLNCAVCHTGTIQSGPDAAPQIVLGMPANQFDLQGYLGFLFASAQDERFSAEGLIPAIRARNPAFSWTDSLIYRWFVIPRTREALLREAERFAWMGSRPPQGPGRVDTFNPYKSRFFGIDLSADQSIGTSDLPPLWNQRIRESMWLHWDGNNNSVHERNKSAGLGAGATPDSLDLPALDRVAGWLMDLPPPAFPADRIDQSMVQSGRLVYEANCMQCHSVQGRAIGQVTPLAEIGTDPERSRSFTSAVAEKMNTLGTGYPWKFTHFRTTNGYVNQPLDGVWLRSPYLHNGSVPTLSDLLKPPAERPVTFFRAYPVYDYVNVGYVSDGPAAARDGFRIDTRERGNGNQGHLYGTTLSPDEKRALIEYLKTQ